MARIRKLMIEGYRSIGERVEIVFPPGQPVVLVGENNAGKSNIVRALELVLGPSWPGNHEPEDHEFFSRDRSRPIQIEIEFDPNEPFGVSRCNRLVWRYNPATSEPVYFRGIDGKGRERYVSNEDRDTCMCIVVEAERNLRRELSYASKWTFLSRLMHRFHRALTKNEAVRDDLKALFDEVKQKFHQIPEFSEFVARLQGELEDLIASMPHRLEVDFEAYNPVNFFHALRLQATEGNEPRTLEEMGTGEQQVLALAFAYAYAKAFHRGIVLVIEEPEAHLHPLAQQWLAQRLRSRCSEGLQVLITTHSPAFISVEGLEGLVLVYKENGSTRVRQLTRGELVRKCIDLGAPVGRVTEDNILPFYAANATTELLSGFFARVVVLVEGPTEALALPVLLAKRGLQVEKEGIGIVSVGGKGNLAKWYRLYKAYGIPCYIVFDNDPRDDPDAKKREDALRTVGIKQTAIDRLVCKEDWIVGEQYTIFGQDFESTMRFSFMAYAELEGQAKQQGVEAKPFIARWVAERLDPNSSDPGWQKVDEMVAKLRNLARASSLSGQKAPGEDDSLF
ncbi:ATP-dependent nuclease [Thermoflexus hugenholtzii]